MTECNQESFEFVAHFSRRVVCEFSCERLTSDGGSLLVRQVDRRLRLLQRFAGCFLDGRDPERIEHTIEEMVAQRVYGLVLGYEDSGCGKPAAGLHPKHPPPTATAAQRRLQPSP
jgi:hypothetical protein